MPEIVHSVNFYVIFLIPFLLLKFRHRTTTTMELMCRDEQMNRSESSVATVKMITEFEICLDSFGIRSHKLRILMKNKTKKKKKKYQKRLKNMFAKLIARLCKTLISLLINIHRIFWFIESFSSREFFSCANQNSLFQLRRRIDLFLGFLLSADQLERRHGT